MKKNECRDYFTFLTLLSLILFILTGVAGTDILAGSADEYVFDTIYLQPHADSLSIDLIEFKKEDMNPKLDSALTRVAAVARLSIKDATALAEIKSLKISDSRVQVEIVTHAKGVENAIDAVIEAGGEVTGVGYYDTLIQAWLPVSVLETMSLPDDIYFIRRPTKGFPTSGNSQTEVLDLMNALAWHEKGIVGAGVKVGVIDIGFEDYTKLLGTDLPAHVTVKNFVDGEDNSQVDGTTKHGTACAEIVHDIAPDAAIYMAKISTLIDLEEAVNWLKDTHKIDIVSTSLSFFNISPGDGTGMLADLVRDARNAGILWVTAAGNYREQHWGGPFYDPDGDNFHNFNGAQFINYFGPGDGTAWMIPAGYKFKVYVRWDDWTNVNQDYDLYLLRLNGASWEIIEVSTLFQNGQPGQKPTEAAEVVTFGDNTSYGFAIIRYSSSRNVNFEVFVPTISRLDEIVYARSLGNLADVPDALTVAALDAALPCPQEPYSSEGPANGPGGTTTGGFIKPDISGFANVFCGCLSNPFSGTSAATPHVAGIAALVLSAYHEYTPDQLQSFLEERAIDIGAAGTDTQFGHGRLFLDEPPPVNEMTWIPAGLDNKYINDLAVDPDSSDTVFAAIKEEHVAITTDYGVSWEYLESSSTDRGAVAIDPQNTSTIYAGFPWKARTNIIYSLDKSMDGGMSWENTGYIFYTLGYHELGVSDIMVHPDNNDIILVAVSGFGIDGGGIHRSVDGGDTWNHTRQIWANALAIDPSAHNIIYFGSQQYGYVFRSTDYGNNWNDISPSVPPGEDWVIEVRDIDVDMDGQVYAATDEGMWKWYKQGWEKLTGITSEDVTAVAIHRSESPGNVYVGTGEDGVFVTKDGGSTWSSMNEGLGNLFITKLSISEGHPKILYAGTDNGGVWSRIIKETSDNDVIIDFGSAGSPGGLWVRYNDAEWGKLHNKSPEAIAVGDMDGSGQDDVITDFGFSGSPRGLWVRYNDSEWGKLHNKSPEAMAVGDMDGSGQDDVIIDFGSSGSPSGLWVRYNDSEWGKLHNKSPEAMALGDMDGSGQDDVIIDFGSSGSPSGLWVRYNDSEWGKLHNKSPEAMALGDMDGSGQDDVIIDFGSSGSPSGLWVRYNDSEWGKLHNKSPEAIAAGDIDGSRQDDVIMDFGATGSPSGIWVRYNDTEWGKLHTMSPEAIAAGDMDSSGQDDVIIDFGPSGSPGGLWVRYNDTLWGKLHNATCESIATGDMDGN